MSADPLDASLERLRLAVARAGAVEPHRVADGAASEGVPVIRGGPVEAEADGRADGLLARWLRLLRG